MIKLMTLLIILISRQRFWKFHHMHVSQIPLESLADLLGVRGEAPDFFSETTKGPKNIHLHEAITPARILNGKCSKSGCVQQENLHLRGANLCFL